MHRFPGLHRASRLFATLLLLMAGWSGSAAAANPAPATAPVITREQIEADWLRQDQVRDVPATPRDRPESTVTKQQDAAGGCDGQKTGRYGFHTGSDNNPWWQVDLGEAIPLTRIVVYNRGDGEVEHRTATLRVLLSLDGKKWQEHYRHDGSFFSGVVRGKPLEVAGRGAKARFVRLQLNDTQYLHLDEVEVYAAGSTKNVALGKPATQSSISAWSTANIPGPTTPKAALAASAALAANGKPVHPTRQVVQRGLKLAADLRALGANVAAGEQTLRDVDAALRKLPSGESVGAAAGAAASTAVSAAAGAARAEQQSLYLKARWAVRRMALANPLLDFDSLVLVKRAPGTFTHMSDQNYGWWSRPGGGLYVLEGFKTDRPRMRCLSASLPLGSVVSPDLSYDGTKILFAHCKFYPGLREEANKLNKDNVPEDAFYHLYEINVDGTGLRRLTRGKYDDFDGRYLPDGETVFLSTRRGQFIRCGKDTGRDCVDGSLPDSYVRCGGGPERPVAVYTLHVMDGSGGNLRQISPFEMFEWTPSVDHEGRILYARWDYIDRWNMPFMSLWSTMPDGTNAQALFKNYTQNPHCVFEARSIPNSKKLIFTASGHHANTGGSLVLLDLNRGADGDAPMTRLTPEVAFPETEGWSQSYFINPYPMSENHYLTAWSDREMIGWPGPPEPTNATGIYLFDAFGNLNLIYRDLDISSMSPLPLKPRPRPHAIKSQVTWDATQEGRMLVVDVYQGLESIPRGAIKQLRLVGVPAKTHPTMNFPSIGLTNDDPGKFVLGSVPVESDGSAYFRVPSGVTLFLQALDADGVAVQTMRSATYVQPGQTHTCVGCHEPRNTSPPNHYPSAMRRDPSRIQAGPDGSWPLDFRMLVQPVLDGKCIACHKPGTDGSKFDLTPAKAYTTLVDFGKPSLRHHVMERYQQGYSIAGQGASQTSPLVKLLKKGHYNVALSAQQWLRLYVWMDTYGQRQGSFGPDQDRRLRELREAMKPMLVAQ